MSTRDLIRQMMELAAATELAKDPRDPDLEGLDDSNDDSVSNYDEDDYTDGGYEIIDDDDYDTGSEANTIGSAYTTFDNFVMKELANTEDEIEYTFKVTVTNHSTYEDVSVVLHGLDEEGFEVYSDSITRRVPIGGTREVTAKMYVRLPAGETLGVR